jgi:hypothetical protein
MRYWLLLWTVCGWALDLREARIVDGGEEVAATVLREELARRSGSFRPGAAGPEIRLGVDRQLAAEEYEWTTGENGVGIAGGSRRGLLYGLGSFLRRVEWGPGRLQIAENTGERSKPEFALRGHQLGYRATSNSYDAWDVAQMDQYVRELVLFGANAVENIPFQDEKPAPLMKVTRAEMHRAMSRMAEKYDIEYWVWLPADFDLTDGVKRAAFLRQFEGMVADSARLDGVFVPGGDPGHNAPELVMPLLEDLARRTETRTRAKIWLSLQGFNREREEYVYRWIEKERPRWLGGLVAGPSSPPAERSRARLPREYGLRLYPDITHNKICQFQVPNWDQAYALTLGREGINPRPSEMRRIFHRIANLSTGFLSYSDGVHDDVNKVVFTMLGWNPQREAREMLVEYARFHFSTPHAATIADAILALEGNWKGPLEDNGGVEATLAAWEKLGAELPWLSGNWRWQMNQLRAVYDAYTRRRLRHEKKIEDDVNGILERADWGVEERVEKARARLAEWPTEPGLRARIEELCAALFRSIGLQTSVPKYGASGAERGAILDFVDHPLNNRWWLEDELEKARQTGNAARLLEIARWERPGAGSFYDDVGHEGRSPRVEMDERDEPMFWWLDQGMSRLRLSEQTTMWPKRVRYLGLERGAKYVVKTGGQGQSLLRVNGERVVGEKREGFHWFRVPERALAEGVLELTWDIPEDEEQLNWRQRSRLSEVWLLRE